MLQAIDDPPLTQQGIQQAHELGLRLKVPCSQVSAQKPEPAVHTVNTVTLQGEHIQQIYSSPFFRTVQTAQEVASCIGDNVTIRIEDGLAEGMLTRKYIRCLICHSTTSCFWTQKATIGMLCQGACQHYRAFAWQQLAVHRRLVSCWPAQLPDT